MRAAVHARTLTSSRRRVCSHLSTLVANRHVAPAARANANCYCCPIPCPNRCHRPQPRRRRVVPSLNRLQTGHKAERAGTHRIIVQATPIDSCPFWVKISSVSALCDYRLMYVSCLDRPRVLRVYVHACVCVARSQTHSPDRNQFCVVRKSAIGG